MVPWDSVVISGCRQTRRKTSLSAVFLFKEVAADFRNPLPFRRLSAKPQAPVGSWQASDKAFFILSLEGFLD